MDIIRSMTEMRDEAAIRAGSILQISGSNMKTVAKPIASRKMSPNLSQRITVTAYDAIITVQAERAKRGSPRLAVDHLLPS